VQYTNIHGKKVLRANIANLKNAISDQNLELIPDYEQRVEVLKELKFIDENSTVLLKGRVACEVCFMFLSFVFFIYKPQ
jgi:antiviral helicase SKI2